MYTFVQQRGGGSRRDPNHKSMYKCAYMYVHLSLSPPATSQIHSLNTIMIDKFEKFQKKCFKLILSEQELSYSNEVYLRKCKQVNILPLMYTVQVYVQRYESFS